MVHSPRGDPLPCVPSSPHPSPVGGGAVGEAAVDGRPGGHEDLRHGGLARGGGEEERRPPRRREAPVHVRARTQASARDQ